jgi:hypothetical protein
MRYPVKGFLAAAAVGAFLTAARPSTAQDFRGRSSSEWRGSGEHRSRGEFRERDGFRDRGLRFRDRDDRRWHGRGFAAPYYGSYGYAAPYPVYDYGYDAYAPGYVAPYAAPAYPYAYGPHVSIRIPFPRFRIRLPRFHARFGR